MLGLAALTSDKRFRAYDVGGQSVLLLFQRGATLETVHMHGGTIPPHDGHGPLHIHHLPSRRQPCRNGNKGCGRSRSVIEEGRTDWSRGGRGAYFRDPDGHLLELATPGLWTIY